MQEEANPVAGTMLSFLSPDDLRHLSVQGKVRNFGADELLLREGDPTNHVYVLETGWVRVSAVLSDGREVLYGLRGPGDVLGEMAAIVGWERTASVRTIEPVRVLQFSGPQFLDCLRQRPSIAVAVIKEMAIRLREAESAWVDLATVDVSRRVASYLLRLAASHGVEGTRGIDIDIPLTQQDIANRVGSSLRAVARAFAVLRSRGVVLTGRKRITLARPDVLRSLSS